jgi:asparagine synthase (glutamine-hydrolysing)
MCGIAGLLKWTHAPAPWNTPARAHLDAMSDAIAHRGPDGAGRWIDPRPDRTAALLHRRLAIIDLPCGAQPMANEDGRVHVVFNGEIYNHAALRNELKAAGHSFSTSHSDTEVLVHGWEQWGETLPSKLLGMFAFAIHDTRPGPDGSPADTLFLARDRMGQKPLFYATLEDGLVFGSTIPSILAWPEVPRRLPREQIALYLLLGYLPAPQTIWRDISQLLPGGWLRVRKDLVDGGRYWTPMQDAISSATASSKFDAAQTQLRTLLTDAVASQLIADVPIACFLSGGIDSSIIAALMQQAVARAGGPPIRTVSVGFADAAFDETAYAADVAKKIGSHHTRLEVRPDQNVLDTLSALMARGLGQPFADSSLLPTFLLSQAVRSLAPVALSGDGADELFGGYDRYRAMRLLSRFASVARFMPRSVPLGSLSKQERYRRLAAAARASIASERYTRLVEIFPPDLAEQLLGEPVMDYFPLPEEYGLDDVDPVKLARIRDQQEYLPNDVLWKVDAAAMQVALEVRSPFLDHRVVQFANGLPEEFLMAGTVGKHILRQTFAAELPPAVFARGKQGFAVPIGNWFRTTLREPLNDLLLGPTSFTAQHLHRPTLERLLAEHQSATRDHTHRLFALLTLALFGRQFSPSVEA